MKRRSMLCLLALGLGVEVVYLPDVQVVGAQQAQGFLQILPGTSCIALHGLGGKDDLVAASGDGLSDDTLVFAFAVRGCRVQVIYPTVQGGAIAVGRLAVGATDAQAGDGQPGAPQGS